MESDSDTFLTLKRHDIIYSNDRIMYTELYTKGRQKEASEKLAKGSFSFQFETFSQFERGLELIFSLPAASVVLFTAALTCGVHSYRRMRKKASAKEEVLRHLSELKNQENWGKISFLDVDFEGGSGKVVVSDSFEAVAHKTDQPCCHFFRGFLAGFLSELFGKSITVIEEKCAGKGDEHCEFVFG